MNHLHLIGLRLKLQGEGASTLVEGSPQPDGLTSCVAPSIGAVSDDTWWSKALAAARRSAPSSGAQSRSKFDFVADVSQLSNGGGSAADGALPRGNNHRRRKPKPSPPLFRYMYCTLHQRPALVVLPHTLFTSSMPPV